MREANEIEDFRLGSDANRLILSVPINSFCTGSTTQAAHWIYSVE
jgi:hypothetical protein